MNTDLNLIANQVNSPLIPFQEGMRDGGVVPGRARSHFAGRLRPRREIEYGSISNRRVQSPTIPINLNESANPINPSDWLLLETKPVDELSEDIIKIIGENGLQRFEQFKKYSEGWDFGIGKPLSSHSVASFKLFCKRLSEPIPVDSINSPQDEPSLFLTREGNLQLGWEDKEGNKIEIEFFPNKIEYYIEALDDEGEVDLTHIYQLVDKLKLVVE